jgi:nucleotide-binding universal stress UspA family protein
MRKLLLPLDGSEFAEETLTSGLAHFANERFEVILLRCIDLNEPIDYSEDFLPQENLEKERHRKAENSYSKYLEEKATEVRKGGHLVTTLVKTGSPVELILLTARKEKVDCIVLTTHGRSGLKRLINGSVTEGVTRRSTCPVLILPPEEREHETQG